MLTIQNKFIRCTQDYKIVRKILHSKKQHTVRRSKLSYEQRQMKLFMKIVKRKRKLFFTTKTIKNLTLLVNALDRIQMFVQNRKNWLVICPQKYQIKYDWE